jgi:hypothetical protein
MKAETERMNHLDALVTINQEKERAEKSVQDLEALLRDRYLFCIFVLYFCFVFCLYFVFDFVCMCDILFIYLFSYKE